MASRVTEYRRLKQFGLERNVSNLKLVDLCFNPDAARKELEKFFRLVSILKHHGIRSTEDLENLLASRGVDNKKPPEGGTSETRAI